jgi:hypothetical protein
MIFFVSIVEEYLKTKYLSPNSSQAIISTRNICEIFKAQAPSDEIPMCPNPGD